MTIRERITTSLINSARSFGRLLGVELVVEQSDHSLSLSMEHPGQGQRAWDPDLFKRGQLFYKGYANPVKVVIEHKPEMGEKDTATITEGNADTDVSEQEADVISSPRYTQYMRNKLITQLLNPQDQYETLVYAVIGIGVLQFITIIVTLWATGSF